MKLKTLCVAYLAAFATTIHAQDAVPEQDGGAEATVETSDATVDADLLTQAELETLVAPVALFPDTVLTQLFIAATQPLEVVKAERLLAENEGATVDELTPLIEAEGFDESVEVLAIGFPEVVSGMAANIDWTETMGLAMLAQTEDVLTAVQTMRQTAINAGTLVSGDEMTVTQDATDAVVIQPTDPEVVYVPQYDTETVYVEQEDTTGDALRNILFAAGTVYLISEIFDDDDDRYYYWGCRNCGGWNGRPIIGNPNTRPNIDGDVNIDIDIENSRNTVWRPDDDRKRDARREINDTRRPANGNTSTLPDKNKPSRTDELRRDLNARQQGEGVLNSERTPSPQPQINQPSARPPASDGTRPALGKTDGGNRPALGGGSGSRPKPGNRPGGGDRPIRR